MEYQKLTGRHSAAKDTDSDEQVAIKKVIDNRMVSDVYALTFVIP